jgi:hypothetical protein
MCSRIINFTMFVLAIEISHNFQALSMKEQKWG